MRARFESAGGASGRVPVWDVPTRVLHWLLVILIVFSWWSGENDELQYHLYSGYAVLWIVLFRIYWGLAGSSTARFSHFVRGPGAVRAYARTLFTRGTPATLGHNPMGALAVLALLAAVLAVVVTGLFSVDIDVLYSGPLSSYVTFRQGRRMAHRHEDLFHVLLVVIAIHLVAVAFYHLYKRHNLVGAMLSGKGEGHGKQLEPAPLWRLLVGAVLVSIIVWAVTTGFYF
jgi:cytochrome b